MIEEEELYLFPSLENAEEEDVDDPEDLEEGEEEEEEQRAPGIVKFFPRIEWKVANTHFKVELTVWAETMDEAKGAAVELFRESLKAVRAR